MWECWPMIGVLSETDFMDNNAQSRPKEVGWRNFPPMRSIPPFFCRECSEDITFGMPVAHLDKDNWENVVCESNSPIVCFKVSTVLQGLGVIASRQRLPSSDVEGDRHKRTYCPTTYKGAEQFYSLGQYSDQLAGAGVPPILAHECCAIPVICIMSDKHQKHPTWRVFSCTKYHCDWLGHPAQVCPALP